MMEKKLYRDNFIILIYKIDQRQNALKEND